VKSLKQLITHWCISRPNASSVDMVDNNNSGLPVQHIWTRVSVFLLSTSNYVPTPIITIYDQLFGFIFI